MKSRVAIVGTALAIIFGVGGCTNSSRKVSSVSSTSTSKSASVKSYSQCTVPPNSRITSPEEANDLPPRMSAQAVALRSLLLTVLDFPPGYSTSPSVIIGNQGQFNAAGPRTGPLAFVDFNYTGNPSSYHEVVYFGLGVSEMLGKTSSAQSAVRMVRRMRMVNQRCNRATPYELRGTAPKLIANIYSGENRDICFLYETTYVSKGPYVAQLTWGEVDLKSSVQRSCAQIPPLPSTASMVQVVDSALHHIPS
jgi:hypothetical protein